MHTAAEVRQFAACDRCGYSLEGLPARGCCPECGKPYLPGAAAVWLDERGMARCNRCGCQLGGCPRQGNCPGCGEWYSCSRLVLAPGFSRRRAALWDWVKRLVGALRPSLRGLAVLLLVLGNAAIVGGLAWYAWREFLKKLGP